MEYSLLWDKGCLELRINFSYSWNNGWLLRTLQWKPRKRAAFGKNRLPHYSSDLNPRILRSNYSLRSHIYGEIWETGEPWKLIVCFWKTSHKQTNQQRSYVLRWLLLFSWGNFKTLKFSTQRSDLLQFDSMTIVIQWINNQSN